LKAVNKIILNSSCEIQNIGTKDDLAVFAVCSYLTLKKSKKDKNFNENLIERINLNLKEKETQKKR